MADRPRTVRLSDDEWSQVEALASAMGTSKARAVAAAVSAALEGSGACAPHTGRIQEAHTPHTASSAPGDDAKMNAGEENGGACRGESEAAAALGALAAQLAVKDAQIADLMAQCARKDEAIAQALEHAQQLHAMEKARPSLGQRVRALFSK